MNIVQVIDFDTDEVVKEFRSETLRGVEKIEDGLNRQLNHKKYFTKIIPQENQQ